jgi:hypothetical protein
MFAGQYPIFLGLEYNLKWSYGKFGFIHTLPNETCSQLFPMLAASSVPCPGRRVGDMGGASLYLGVQMYTHYYRGKATSLHNTCIFNATSQII